MNPALFPDWIEDVSLLKDGNWSMRTGTPLSSDTMSLSRANGEVENDDSEKHYFENSGTKVCLEMLPILIHSQDQKKVICVFALFRYVLNETKTIFFFQGNHPWNNDGSCTVEQLLQYCCNHKQEKEAHKNVLLPASFVCCWYSNSSNIIAARVGLDGNISTTILWRRCIVSNYEVHSNGRSLSKVRKTK